VIRRLVIPRLSWVLVAGVAAFGAIAGFQLGGGTVPIVPALSDGLFYAAAVGLFGLGIFGTLLRRPDIIGRIAPTFYVLVALLPQLWFVIPAIDILRFIPLALIAPVVYGLFRDAEAVASHTNVTRVAVFAALAVASASLIANWAETDFMRLALMVGGIVLLVSAAPRAWSGSWHAAVERAVGITFFAIVASTLALLPLSNSFVGGRLQGPFDSPNTLGALLALSTPIAASRSRFPALYWAIAFGLSVASGSRGGMLALTVAAVVLIIQRRRVVPIVGLFVIGLIVLSTGVVRTETDNEQVFGINTRSLIWSEVLEASLDAPIVGHGFGAVDDFAFSNETRRWAGNSPQTHNSWLDILYEQGILGIILWAVALFLGLAAAVRAGPIWIATIAAGLVSATFESWLFAIGGGIGSLFWLIFGAAALGAYGKQVDEDHVSRADHDLVEGTPVEEVREVPQRTLVFSSELPPGPVVGSEQVVPIPTVERSLEKLPPTHVVVASVKSYPPAFRSGGPTRSVAELVDALHGEIDFRVITSLDDNGHDLRDDGVHPIKWQRRNHAQVSALPRGPLASLRIIRQLRSIDADILYLNSLFNPVFSLVPLLALRLGVLNPVRTIVAPRGELDRGALALKRTQKRFALLLLRSLGITKGVVWHATAAEEASNIARHFGQGAPVVVAPNLHSLEVDSPAHRPGTEEIRVVFMSKVDRKKNLETAVDAVARCKSATLAVIGPIKDEGYWSEIQARVHSSGLADRFTYLGPVEPDLMIATLAEFDLFLLPTRGENFGHAILEALAAGLPVLLSGNTPWNRVDALGAGWVRPADDVKGFAECVQAYGLMTDDDRYAMRLSAAQIAQDYVNDRDPIDAHRKMFLQSHGGS